MASRKQQQIRRKFTLDVFMRDNYTCKICTEPFAAEDAAEELEAHYITAQNEMPNEGSVSENGITLCKPCHRDVQQEPHILGQRPQDLYGKIGTTFKLAFQKSELLEE